jgi:hypothetical protein
MLLPRTAGEGTGHTGSLSREEAAVLSSPPHLPFPLRDFGRFTGTTKVGQPWGTGRWCSPEFATEPCTIVGKS